MSEKISIKNKAGDIIFLLTATEMKEAPQQNKAGEHFYLLEYDYAKDLLVKNKDPENVSSELQGLAFIIGSELKGEEFYIFVSTVLEPDMIEAYADIEFGSILKIDQQGTLIGDLLQKEKEIFSAVDESELADLEIDMPISEANSKGEYVDPAEALVKTFKKEGYESYERKDVLEKYAEEKKEKEEGK